MTRLYHSLADAGLKSALLESRVRQLEAALERIANAKPALDADAMRAEAIGALGRDERNPLSAQSFQA